MSSDFFSVRHFPTLTMLVSPSFFRSSSLLLLHQVAQPPSDSVSSLSFSPKANFLIATSWDNQVLCSTWNDEGMIVCSRGCDKQVKMWPLLSGGQPMTVAMHDAPIKEVAWIPEMNLYWDTRQSNLVHTQQLLDRCYALTVK
ncbi:protein RAE1-like [Gossypium arboreum]|uniref:protein RAE1-like n=1 Tax=Gossypium arboreum TaxID=29729 RepID=UPI0022F191C3|nr:protein RAE1-like [Gossypium arboreum]